MGNYKRVGIIGAGMMGEQHAEAIRRNAGIEIVALADQNYELACEKAEKLHIKAAYADYLEMLHGEMLDAVHICTPNHMHISMCREALLAGVSVFCEKPLGNSSKETAELAALSKEKGLVCGVNFNYRQNAIVREMHELVSQPEWGRSFMVRGEYIQDWMMYDTDYNWRCINEINGPSRAVADIGSHWFDAIQYITGKRITRVFAKLFTIHEKRKKYERQVQTFANQLGGDYTLVDISSEDAAYILLELQDGIPGILTISQVSAGYKNGMTVSIDGSAKSITWEQENADKLFVRTRENGVTMRYAAAGGMHGSANAYASLPAGHPVGWADGLKNSIKAFYSTLDGNNEMECATFAEADYVARIVEACLKSNKLGIWIDVQ